MRPLLKTALARLWRDTDTLQLGLDPASAVVLDGVDPRGLRLLALLDGTRDVAAVLADAEPHGVDAAQVRTALAVLASAGVLDDADVPGPPLPAREQDRLAPDVAALTLAPGPPGLAARRLARRRVTRLRLHGAGRVGAPLAAILAASGIGHVGVVDGAPARVRDAAPGGLRPDDAGRPRDVATVDLVRRTAPSTTVTAGAGSAPATLVVLVGDQVHDLGLRAALMSGRTPHLAARVRDVTGVVGPLVLPGSTPCLDCLDLHRRDRDADWPLLAAQLASPGAGTAPCDTALAVAVAGCAALQVLAHVDGEPAAAEAGTLELTPPDHRWRRRSWPLHPGCGCVA